MKRPSIVPLFATQGTSLQLVEPPSGVRELGFAAGTRPPAQWVNFQLHGLGNWVDRLRSPNRANWSRGVSPGVNYLQLASDTTSNDATLDVAIRKLIAIDDTATATVNVSVRGDDWTQISMLPGGSIGGSKCVCRSPSGWYVAGFAPGGVNGGIWSTPADPDPTSAIGNPANSWTVESVPVGTTPVLAIASRLTGSGVGSAAAVTTTQILYLSSGTTWLFAALGTAFGGPGTDVCDTGSAFLAATATGQVFRATSLSGTWSEVTVLGAATWRLAADDAGTVVAYPVGAVAGTSWYVSTDHGLTWAAHAPPAHIAQIRRIRFIDGSWLLTCADFPHLAESNDLSATSWARLAVPIVTGATRRLDDVALVDEGLVAVGEGHWLTGARGELVAPGPWSPVGSSLPFADAGYLRGRVVSSTAPAGGDVLTWDAGSSTWKPTAPSGGGSLPAGTNGGVLRYAGGAWASTGAGTAGQVLTSNGAAAAGWGQTVLPLTQRAVDAAAAAVSVCAQITHDLSAGVGAAGIGARCAFNVLNGAGDITPVASIDAVAIDTTGGAEVGVLDVVVTSTGAVDARCARFWPSGVALGGVTSALPSDAALGLKWATRSIVVRSSLDSAWLDVWRVDGSGFWTFGSTSSSSGGVVLLAPSTGEIYLRRGTDDYLGVDSSGNLTVGLATKPTALRGSTITASIDDATTAGVTTVFTLRHTTTGTAAAGIGTRLLLQTEDASGATEDAAAIEASFTNAGNGTEASQLDFFTRTGGAALARALRLYPSGGIGVGNSGTNNDPGNGGICLPITNGLYVSSGGTNYTCAGVFGGSTMIFGSGAFNVQINSYSLSISAGQGMGLNNGWFTLAAAAGYRTPPTVVTNTNVTATANNYTIEVKGLTAARVVTLPAHVAGTRVMVFCSDGSCSAGNKITVTPASGTINGAATYDLTSAYAVCEVISNGTNWTIVHTR